MDVSPVVLLSSSMHLQRAVVTGQNNSRGLVVQLRIGSLPDRVCHGMYQGFVGPLLSHPVVQNTLRLDNRFLVSHGYSLARNPSREGVSCFRKIGGFLPQSLKCALLLHGR